MSGDWAQAAAQQHRSCPDYGIILMDLALVSGARRREGLFDVVFARPPDEHWEKRCGCAEPPCADPLMHALGSFTRWVVMHALGSFTRWVVMHALGSFTRWVVMHALGSFTRWVVMHALGSFTRWVVMHALGSFTRWVVMHALGSCTRW
eukprot:gene5095-56023_t